MTISRVEGNETLVIEFDGGIVDGKQKYKRKHISNLNDEATDDAFHKTAMTLADLQESNVLAVKMKGTDELVQS